MLFFASSCFTRLFECASTLAVIQLFLGRLSLADPCMGFGNGNSSRNLASVRQTKGGALRPAE